jgi:hypothetical protein
MFAWARCVVNYLVLMTENNTPDTLVTLEIVSLFDTMYLLHLQHLQHLQQ